MMIKYRVHEVAKDLNVPSKEIIDLLQKHFGEVKKHMTALTEEELDVIFEHYTQLKALPNFDAYFAENKTVAEDQAAQAAAEAVEADCCGEHPPSAPSAATLIVPAAAPFKKSRRDQLCFEVVPMFPLPSIMCPCSDPGVARFCCAAPDVRLHYGAGRGFAITESDDFGIRRVRRTRPPYS